jgi:2,4-dienoyl-CoA reductase-like NADH-dependent reductase (Old Yellow Enzyme family)
MYERQISQDASKTQTNQIRTTRPLERVYADLVGPMKTEADGKKYLLNVVDYYSRITFVKGLRYKDDAGIAILDIIEQAERISAHKTTNFQADNDGEFRNKILEQQLRSTGICVKETVPRHSETNQVIERTNRKIVTMARTALIASDLPKKLWLEATKHAALSRAVGEITSVVKISNINYGIYIMARE